MSTEQSETTVENIDANQPEIDNQPASDKLDHSSKRA
jgi:hypothetical protein